MQLVSVLCLPVSSISLHYFLFLKVFVLVSILFSFCDQYCICTLCRRMHSCILHKQTKLWSLYVGLILLFDFLKKVDVVKILMNSCLQSLSYQPIKDIKWFSSWFYYNDALHASILILLCIGAWLTRLASYTTALSSFIPLDLTVHVHVQNMVGTVLYDLFHLL